MSMNFLLSKHKRGKDNLFTDDTSELITSVRVTDYVLNLIRLADGTEIINIWEIEGECTYKKEIIVNSKIAVLIDQLESDKIEGSDNIFLCRRAAALLRLKVDSYGADDCVNIAIG